MTSQSDIDRKALRELLDEGRESTQGEPLSTQTFDALRERAALVAVHMPRRQP